MTANTLRQGGQDQCFVAKLLSLLASPRGFEPLLPP